jgi:formylglycine-generating enzyme required for sulfatase activity
MASAKPPRKITPWRGKARGFSFKREVQPVLDKHCVGCHDGAKRKGPAIPDFATKTKRGFNGYTPSYIALHPYVRRNGPEGDYHVLTPLEFHADTSELVQMLQRGHHNVKVDAEAWDRLVTWIDLNVPDHGTWSEFRPVKSNFAKRRHEMQLLYASIDDDPERIDNTYPAPAKFIKPDPAAKQTSKPITLKGWPFKASGDLPKRTIDLGDGVNMTLVKIPAGRFVAGSTPQTPTSVDRPFWMQTTEVTLQQYQRFDASHKNGYYDRHNKDQVDRGWAVNDPEMPVIRVSRQQAAKFCAWLAKKSKMKITLPTETQWEWACRAGTATSHWYGDADTDFSKLANLADASISKLCWRVEMSKEYQDFIPRDNRSNDGVHTLAKAGSYKTNPWGLHDMHGNVSEWTSSTAATGRQIVRGGSWRDRPAWATSAFRLAFPKWQKVYNVGFRIICQDN